MNWEFQSPEPTPLTAPKHKPIGLRTLKTAMAVFLASLLMKYVFHQTPFFACIGAVAAVERTMSSSFRAALIRNVGTVTGGLIGIVVGSLTKNLLVASLGLIPFICLDDWLGKKESVVPGAIVYFATVYQGTLSASWGYGFSRIFGTLLGSVVGILVNAYVFPPHTEGAAHLQPQKAAAR